MNGLDLDALQQAHDWAAKFLSDADRRARRRPVLEAIMGKRLSETFAVTTDLTAEAGANSRRATLSLEQTMARQDEESERPSPTEATLKQARKRTAALTAWLEALE